jgi:hypothetical protein
MNFLKGNFWEIERTPRLFQFSTLFSFIHVIAYFLWSKQTQVIGAEVARPILCWGFYENCQNSLVVTKLGISFLLGTYLTFAILAFFSSLWRRSAFATWILVLFTSALHLLIYSLDAGRALDIHGLIVVLGLGYLFVPNKLPFLRTTIVVFHVFLAWRELSPDWLSGAGLIGALPFPLKGLEWMASMGVSIKMTLSLLLVSATWQRMALGAAGLMGYHGFIFYFRHDFSSFALMLLILFYVLDYLAKKKSEFETLYQSYAHPEPSKLWWPMAVSVYVLIQLFQVGESSSLRLVSIAGPPISRECHHVNFANYKNRIEQLQDFAVGELAESVKCHPLAAFNLAKEICARRKSQPDFIGLTSGFLIRRPNEESFSALYNLDNICDEKVTYRSAVQK